MAEGINPELSIIILNYNVKDLLLNCLESVFASKGELDRWQVIVVDNASNDGSVEAVKEKYGSPSTGSTLLTTSSLRSSTPRSLRLEEVDLIENQSNLGFASGNNVGVKKAKAPVILFLNPDTVITDHAIQKTLEVLLSNPDYGAVTCKIELPDGRLDYSCHRGFPAPWNSLCYFSGLSKLFPRSPIFAGYTASYLDTDQPHEIDCATGAFLMVKKIAGDQISWWDTDYFFNGEDIEFCYSLKEKGWKIYYYPEVRVVHYKGSSSGLWKTAAQKVDKKQRLETAIHGVSAMRIFYMKHYYKKYSPIFRDIALWGIKLLEHYRKFKIMTELRYE